MKGRKKSLYPVDLPIVIQLGSSSIYKPFRASFLGIEIQSTGTSKIEFNRERLVVIMFRNQRFVF
jgi:hypothetical protein